MRLFDAPTTRQVDVSLALLRIATGIIFAAHGGQKLFQYGVSGVAGGFEQMGIPLASVAAAGVSYLEFFGGIALVFGLLTRIVAVGLAITALTALFIVHLPAGFFLPKGYEFVLILFAAASALAISGPGAYSVDAMIGKRRN